MPKNERPETPYVSEHHFDAGNPYDRSHSGGPGSDVTNTREAGAIKTVGDGLALAGFVSSLVALVAAFLIIRAILGSPGRMPDESTRDVYILCGFLGSFFGIIFSVVGQKKTKQLYSFARFGKITSITVLVLFTLYFGVGVLILFLIARDIGG